MLALLVDSRYNDLQHGCLTDFALQVTPFIGRFLPVIELRLKQSQETRERLDNAGLDAMVYDKRRARYRIRLQPGEIEKNKDVLAAVIKEAYEASSVR